MTGSSAIRKDINIFLQLYAMFLCQHFLFPSSPILTPPHILLAFAAGGGGMGHADEALAKEGGKDAVAQMALRDA